MTFHILKKSKHSRARLGLIETKHGVVETPCVVPVATRASIKTLSSEQAMATGAQMLIANTFHLHVRPGETIVKKAGGLHTFMNWPRPLMTDSAGYQVFSLGFGRDHGVGKVAKDVQHSTIRPGQRPKLLRITDDGVRFRSPIDGRKIFIGPRESIRIQEALGADIMFAFDECTSPLADYAYTKKSLDVTHAWARTCLDVKRTSQALYGVVQGGKFEDLRRESARVIGRLGFDGIGIGGEFGADKRQMASMIRWVVDEVSDDKPRHLLGIGYPEDIPVIIKEGIDTFDITVPTHLARRGIAFVPRGRLDLTTSSFLRDQKPVDASCGCATCSAGYRRSYLAHLFRAGEFSAMSLLTVHNLFFFHALVASYRKKIKNGTF